MESMDFMDVSTEQFNTAMTELIELQQAQLDALSHMYSLQLFCIGVIAAVAVVMLLSAVIHKFF